MRINTGFDLVFSKNDLFLKYVRILYVFHEIFNYIKVINLNRTSSLMILMMELT